MRKLRALILLSFLGSPLIITGNAQTPLQLGTSIEREIGPGQAHEFTVKMEENNLIQLVIEQRGIDVVVKVSTPNGNSIGEYDSPNGGQGPEHVSFVAAAAGSYRITVVPLNPEEVTVGRYEIKLLELRRATDQELKTSRNLADVKEKGLALLNEIDRTIPEIKSPVARIRAQLEAARLLWESDEKRSSKYLADAITGLKEFLASLDPDDRYFPQRSAVWQMRYEIAQVLAGRDPDAALSFVYSTSQLNDPNGNQREHLTQESMIELAIANHIIRNDPARTLQIARRNLKKGYSSSLFGTVSQLRQQKPELAAELAGEIVSKLLDEKLLKNLEATGLALNLIRFSGELVRRVQTREGFTPPPPLLPEEKYRNLFQKVLTEALSYSQPASRPYNPERDAAWNMLSTLVQMGPQLEMIMPGSVAAVEKKMAEFNSPGHRYSSVSPQYQNMIGNNSVDVALEAIGKMPSELREQYYAQLANRQANSGDLARAKQIINDHVSNPYQRRQYLINIEQQGINQAMVKGRVEEALRTIDGFRNTRERAQQLAQIANQIGLGKKRATALNLLEQARNMLNPSPQAQDQDQMNALFEIARAFSRYDSKRAFEIVDPLIDQFNELCTAARTLDGFGPEYYNNDELDLQNGNTLASIAGLMSNLLGSLALTNFDRTKSTSDRISLPEVRLRAYLDIARQTIQAAK